MIGNKDRPATWKIGSFTKNFRWNEQPGLKRLYDAIRIGFDGSLVPVPRKLFRERIAARGYIDFIPINFFLYNQEIAGDDYVVVDELVYQALSFPHRQQFDRLSIFSLLLSEVGRWRGAPAEQANPSEWARHFVTDYLSKRDAWPPEVYSANRIEEWLESRREFQGTTRKLSTNLSFLFNKGDLGSIRKDPSIAWYANAVFLALDRYYLKLKPDLPNLPWALDVLAENDVADLSSAQEVVRIAAEKSIARLFVEVHGPLRFEGEGAESSANIIAVLSRQPLVAKELPAIAEQWLRSRLFVEIAKDETEIKKLTETDYSKVVSDALTRIHNSLPKPLISGDDAIALFRTEE